MSDDIVAVRAELSKEQQANKSLQEQVEKLKKENEHLKTQFVVSEQEEDLIVNQLLKRLEEKKKEKEHLLVQVEQEEEYLTNTLQQKLLQVRLEKVDLENQLEQEEEYLTNKLQKQLSGLNAEKDELLKKLEAGEEIQEKMRTELKEFRELTKKNEAEYNNYKKWNNRLRQQLEKLKTDNFVLNQRINSGQEKFNEIKKEKFLLEADMERQSERVFNTQNRNTKRGRSVSHNPIGTASRNSRISLSPERDVFDMSASPLSKGFSTKRPGASTPIGIDLPFYGGTGDSQAMSPPSVAMSCSPSTSLLSSSFVESFLQSRTQESASRSCIRRGWLKKLSEGIWVQCMFVVYDNGELMFCDSESGVTICVNLDTVIAVNDVSKQTAVNSSYQGGVYPSFTFEVKTNDSSYILNGESAKEHAEWIDLLRELSPMAQ